MKKLFLLALVLCGGCVITPPRNAVVLVKYTTFGLDVSQDPTGAPHMRLGLVRGMLMWVPTRTNSAPNFESSASADIGFTGQHAVENIKVNEPHP